MVLTIVLVAKYEAQVIDVKGAFLKGNFKNNKETYMTVPERFKKHYPNNNTWLCIMKPIYALKQAGLYYYRKAKGAMQANRFEQSGADPCLFFTWTPEGIVILLTWVDDNLIIAPPLIVENEKDIMKQHFECNDIGDLRKYIRCEIDWDWKMNSIKITQPVLVQSLEDELKLPPSTLPQTPAKPGITMTKYEDKNKQSKEMHTKYRAGIEKLQYLV